MMCLRRGIERILILFNSSTEVCLRLSHASGHTAVVQATTHWLVHGLLLWLMPVGCEGETECVVLFQEMTKVVAIRISTTK